MNIVEDCYNFRIGDIEGLVIKDSSIECDEAKLFAAMTKTEARRLLEKYGLFPLRPLDVLCILIKTRGHSILVDTGSGMDRRSSSGALVKILMRERVDLGSIDTIILTHAHGDHIGGITDNVSNPVFHNARYVMSRPEWDYWLSSPDLSKLDKNMQKAALNSIHKNLRSLAGRYELASDGDEVLPGVRVFLSPGHSPGHVTVEVSSGPDKLVCSGDVVHHPLQITRPAVNTDFDLDPAQANLSRSQFINKHASTNSLVFACHFPFPGIGHIKTKDRLPFWSPI